MKVDYFSGEYLPDDSAWMDLTQDLGSRAIETAYTFFTADDSLRETAGSQAVAEDVLDVDGEYGAAFRVLMSAGSILSCPSDFLLESTAVGTRLGVKYAAAMGLTSAWYAVNYPILGGALATLGWCGPPGWLVAGAGLVGVKITGWVFTGVKGKVQRSRACEALKIAYPLCVRVIESDGKVTPAEAGYLRDLVMKSPFERGQWSEATTSNNYDQALEALSSAGTAARREVLKHVILAAYADAQFAAEEEQIVLEIGKRSGEKQEWFSDQISQIARQMHNSSVLADAVFRSCLYIAHWGCEELGPEEMEMLNVLLLSLFRDEGQRRALAQEALQQGPSRVTEAQIARALRASGGLFDGVLKGMWKSKSDLGETLQQVLDQSTMFLLSIGENGDRLAGLRMVAKGLGFTAKDADKCLARTTKQLEKLEKKLNKVALGTCPYCGDSGNFQLVKQCLVERDLYKCKGCGKEVMVCYVPSCTDLAKTGDFWDDRLCPTHTDAILRRDERVRVQ